MPDTVIKGTTYCGYVFIIYFLVEMIVKVSGLGPRVYASDNFNLFDAAITVVGVVQMTLDLAAPDAGGASAAGPLSAFRALRILRLAQSWKGLDRIISVMLSSLLSVGWLIILLLLFLFIAGLLGMTVSY